MASARGARRRVCCWVALLLLPACGSSSYGSWIFGSWIFGAQLPSPSPSAGEQGAQLYRIRGRVVDSRSGAAVPRCAVEIVEVTHGAEAHTMRTGEDGGFAFEGIPPAKYRLSAGKPGYLTQSFEQHEDYSTAIAVGPGRPSEELLFKLTAGAVLSGSVTDDAGEPVRQAQVRLYRDQEIEGIHSTRQQTAAMTDDRGVYELTNITPGTYFLSVSAHPWYARPQRGHPDSSPGGVDLDVAYPIMFYAGVSDSDAATPIPVKGGERLKADFILHAEHAMHLRLPWSEGVRSGLGISISRSVFGEPERLEFSQVTAMEPDALEVDGLLPGHYDVEMTSNSAGHPSSSHLFADLADGSARISEAEDKANAAVVGKVTPNEGKLPPQSAIALVVLHSRRAYLAALNDAGEFALSVPPGSYEVLGQINHHYLASISASGASLQGRVLTLKEGGTSRLQIATGNSYGRIDGTVLRDKTAASAAMVLLVPDNPAENHILFRRDQSDSDGTFTLAGILPGHYRLVAIERGWELEWANPAVLAPFLLKGIPVEVGGNDHLEETVELQTR